MDVVTHAVLGATLATALSLTRRAPEPLAQRRIAAGIGAAAGLLPDADALIQSGADALLVLDYHRHFTHALAFVPIGALIAATSIASPATSRIRCLMRAPATVRICGCPSRSARKRGT